MINWRRGKAGFVGASKRLIKGFFDFKYTLTSTNVIPSPPISVPVESPIDWDGIDVESGIVSDGIMLSSLILESLTVKSGIVGNIITFNSKIDNEILTLHTGL